jgi:hypothetical protein
LKRPRRCVRGKPLSRRRCRAAPLSYAIASRYGATPSLGLALLGALAS